MAAKTDKNKINITVNNTLRSIYIYIYNFIPTLSETFPTRPHAHWTQACKGLVLLRSPRSQANRSNKCLGRSLGQLEHTLRPCKAQRCHVRKRRKKWISQHGNDKKHGDFTVEETIEAEVPKKHPKTVVSRACYWTPRESFHQRTHTDTNGSQGESAEKHRKAALQLDSQES